MPCFSSRPFFTILGSEEASSRAEASEEDAEEEAEEAEPPLLEPLPLPAPLLDMVCRQGVSKAKQAHRRQAGLLCLSLASQEPNLEGGRATLLQKQTNSRSCGLAATISVRPGNIIMQRGNRQARCWQRFATFFNSSKGGSLAGAQSAPSRSHTKHWQSAWATQSRRPIIAAAAAIKHQCQ